MEPPRPKGFEIRKGRVREDGTEETDDDEAPLGPVFLPKSITQEAEEESLKNRFGVEALPEGFTHRHGNVRMTDSAGATGPERASTRRNRALLVVLLVLAVAGGAAYYAKTQGLLAQWLP